MKLISIELQDINNKWIVRSALQKSIRRGETEKAIKYASLLYSLDVNYLRRALAVIAVEDVGVANPKATMKAVEIYRNVKLIKESPDVVIGDVITDLCSGVKSRAFCELCFAVELKEGKAKYSNHEELLAQADSDDYEVSYKAVTEICSNKTLAGLKKQFLANLTYVFSGDVLGLVEQCLAVNIEGMSFAAYTVCKLVDTATDVEVEEGVFPESVKIKGVASQAYDMHTHTGKIALKALYTSLHNNHVHIAEIAPSKAVKALGSIIFIGEGGLLDKRLTNPDLDVLKDNQDREFMLGYGVPQAKTKKIVKIVLGNVALLNSKREWASTL